MGVQPRGKKKSEMEELREQVRGMQMEIDELKRATQDGRPDAGSGAAAASKRQKEATHRPARCRSPPSESDDDEETPE
jgi:hypothetical protein